MKTEHLLIAFVVIHTLYLIGIAMEGVTINAFAIGVWVFNVTIVSLHLNNVRNQNKKEGN